MEHLLPIKDLRRPPCILTRSGEYFYFDNPEAYDWQIEVIGHSLGNLCRFNGQVNEFYSVAQHSVIVSYLVPEELALPGLLHDGGEMVLGDMSSPLKSLFPEYKELQNRVDASLFRHFGLPAVEDPRIKIADLIALATEKRDLMIAPKELSRWASTENSIPMSEIIIPLDPKPARELFLARYREIILKGCP